MKLLSLLLIAAAAAAQNYTARQITEQGVSIVRLADAATAWKFGDALGRQPGLRNESARPEHPVLPLPDLAQYDAAAARCRAVSGAVGQPAERGRFWANGKKYAFNLALGNVRARGLPIHGVLVTSPLWNVTEVAADAHSARVTSRLEFWKEPDLMAQWPFAHEYEMTYSLADGVLEVRVTVTNLSSKPMPLVIGFHPYYRIPDIPRDEWTRTCRPARRWWPTIG